MKSGDLVRLYGTDWDWNEGARVRRPDAPVWLGHLDGTVSTLQYEPGVHGIIVSVAEDPRLSAHEPIVVVLIQDKVGWCYLDECEVVVEAG